MEGDYSLIRYSPFALFNDHERLAEFDRLAVLDENLRHGARARRGIWFIVFIASMISSVCPADTLVPTR